jgi:hypothetical protein
MEAGRFWSDLPKLDFGLANFDQYSKVSLTVTARGRGFRTKDTALQAAKNWWF